MGKRKTVVVFLLIILCILCITCKTNKVKTDEDYITEWVKKTYGSASTVSITSTVDSSLSDRIVYRGYIVSGDKKLEGIFFYNPTNHEAAFTVIN